MSDNGNYQDLVKYYSERYAERNILEIIQKENSETVLVNAASFFLHPKNGGKKIEDRLLKNLMDAIGKKYPEDTGKFLCIENEFPCEEDEKSTKRIDIMIEFEKYCIAIEAKVDAKLDNPLDKYSDATTDRSNGKEPSGFVLIKEKNLRTTEEYIEQMKNKPGKMITWNVITWEELLDGIEDYIEENEILSISNPYENLIDSLIKIYKKPKGLEDIEENLRNDLDIKLKKLQTKLDESSISNEYNLYEWSGDKELREVIEPRLVLENKENLFKIDICVGIRGLQFVVFKKSGYSSKLFKAMCDKYPFYYWQDYLDNYELYNRFVICYRDDEKDDVKGPQFPQNPDDKKSILGIKSVKRKDTVLVEYDENDEWLDLACNKLNEIKEYLEEYLKSA
jgi:hypothetical protein